MTTLGSSDAPPAPDWWLASDGRWYPPHLHPSRLAAAVPSAPSWLTSPGSAPPSGVPDVTSLPATRDFVVGQAPGATHPPFPESWYADTAVRSTAGSAGRSRRTAGRLVVVGVAAIVAALGTTAGLLVGSAGTDGWVDASLHVVGSPVAVDGAVLVLDVSAHHQLQLSAVDPAHGTVRWRRPFTASEITPGVAFAPTVLGDTVLELSPAGGSDDPATTVEGLDAASGRVMWSLPQPIVLTDAPAVCGGEFCVATYLSATATGLVVLDPATGRVVGAAVGPERSMLVAPPGSSDSGGLWETDATKPTLTEVSTFGQALWTRTVAGLFGGAQYDPDYGWGFLTRGSLDVGSVGAEPIGTTYPLDQFRTLGIAVSDGDVEWRDPGQYLCGGGLQFLTADVICDFSGTATEVGTSVHLSGVGVTLEGVDAATGAVTWTLPVRGAQALSVGNDVAFADGTHLVVQRLSGQRALLDVVSGALAPLPTGGVFWCERNPMYTVTTAQGASAGGQRQSSPVFGACAADGRAVPGLPGTAPGTVGVLEGGMFVWPTAHGLRAVPRPG